MSLFYVDSGCDFSTDTIKKLGIDCINIPYMINDKDKVFDENFEYDKFYSKVRKGVVVSEKNLNEEELLAILEPIIVSDDIIYIHSSRNIKNCDTLYSVREHLITKYPDRKFELIDSANISIGQGVFSYLLAKMYRNGSSIDEIVNASESLKNEVAMYVVVESLEDLSNHNLFDGKKVSGTALNIKPIITIDIEGKFQLVEKVSGRKKAINKLVEIVRQRGENLMDYPIAISHSLAEDDAKLIESKMKEFLGNDIQLLMERMSPTSTSLLGLNAVAVSFHVHSKVH